MSLARDPNVTELHCAPGNVGIATIAVCHPIDLTSPDSIAALAVDLRADFVILGPEGPLVAGAAAALRSDKHTAEPPSLTHRV